MVDLRKPSILTLICCFFLSAVSQGQPQSVSLDVNDISILFPLKDGGVYPLLNLKTTDLMGDELFSQVLLFENPGKDLSDLPYLDGFYVAQPKNWFVTSFRVDPCGDQFSYVKLPDRHPNETVLALSKAPGCQPRLRVVVQPFNAFGHPLPSAMHLLYRLTKSEFEFLVEDLSNFKLAVERDLGVITTGVPLTVHPGLEEALRTKKMDIVKRLKDIFLRNLRFDSAGARSRLDMVTLNIQSSFNHWRLIGGIVEGSQWKRFVTDFSRSFYTPNEIETRLGLEVLTCDLNPTCTFSPLGQPNPADINGTYLTYIFQDTVEMKNLQRPGFRTPALQLEAEVVDDPSSTHFFNTNCMSCHQSANLRDYERLHRTTSSPEGVTPFVPQRNLSPFVNTVINFGYQGLNSRVSTRTAAESAMVAHFLNEHRGVLGGAPKRNLETFWRCLVSESDWKKCL